MAEDRDSLLLKASELLKEWDAKLGDLESQFDKTKESAKEEARKKIDELKQKREDLQAKMKQWQDRSSGALEDIQKELERLGDELAKSFSNIFDHVKKIFQSDEKPKTGETDKKKES